ncbi:MAG: hypothetical protein AB1Y36_03495 [Cycloclasticus sp.]
MKYRQFINHFTIFSSLCLIALGLYYLGLSGPFLFDDHGNITENALLRIDSLTLNELKESALSGHAGPLGRPIAMLSFAVNYFFSGNYSSFAFKTTNVIIHASCGHLLFIFCSQIFQRIDQLRDNTSANKHTQRIAMLIAIAWLVHPINLTSVLYIVQRMTSLSTLFSLASLCLYLSARKLQTGHNALSTVNIRFLASVACFFLAIYSKENALLLPVYVLILEWSLFSNQTPWRTLAGFSAKNKKLFIPALVITALLILDYCINYALPGYNSRHFSMPERLLTEARVVTLYLFLIIIPRIDAFGLFHDDIPLSTSLISPWTTIPSIAFITILIGLAFYYKKQKPAITIGLLIFFSGHLMESTIFALEIAHEHRNHLPSTGIIIAIAGIFYHSSEFRNKRKTLLYSGMVILILGATTMLRAKEWSSQYSIASYEAYHHPNSPATLTMLSTAAYRAGRPDEALTAIKRSESLAPFETSYSISHAALLALEKQEIPNELKQTIFLKLTDNFLTPSTEMTIAHISKHIHKDKYSGLVADYIEWLEHLLIKLDGGPKTSAYYYFLAKGYIANGQILEALNSYQRSHELDALYINPLIEMGNIFLTLKQVENAELILETLILKSQTLERDYSKQISKLGTLISQMKASEANP